MVERLCLVQKQVIEVVQTLLRIKRCKWPFICLPRLLRALQWTWLCRLHCNFLQGWMSEWKMNQCIYTFLHFQVHVCELWVVQEQRLYAVPSGLKA